MRLGLNYLLRLLPVRLEAPIQAHQVLEVAIQFLQYLVRVLVRLLHALHLGQQLLSPLVNCPDLGPVFIDGGNNILNGRIKRGAQ